MGWDGYKWANLANFPFNCLKFPSGMGLWIRDSGSEFNEKGNIKIQARVTELTETLIK